MKCPVCKGTDFKAHDLQVEGFSEGIFECRTCGSIWSLQHGLVEIIKDSQKDSFLGATPECGESDDYQNLS